MKVQAMQAVLAARQHSGLKRQLKVLESVQGAYLAYQGRHYLNFSGNDYLGLSADAQVKAALAQGALDYGVGSTGSPLITGQHRAHQQLSEQIAAWVGTETVLLFSSGFAANQAMLLGLAAEQDLLLLDKLCHASMIDAALQHPGGYKRFLHNDLASFTSMLAKTAQQVAATQGEIVVATEGVFSMDGDSPDLAAIHAVCQRYQCPLLLDDAHGFGTRGPQGAGSLAAAGLSGNDVQCLMGNFGKALGGQGGFLATSTLVADYLMQTSRHFIYSTALSPALAVAMQQSIALCQTQAWRREKLAENIQRCRELAQHYDLQLLPSDSAIQPLLIGDSDKAVAVSQQLAAQGIWLHAIRPPTVPQQQARLRITLSALHQPHELERLFICLRGLL